MSNSDALDRANSLIKMGQNYLAVPILEEHIRQNQRDYRAWGLMALAQDDPTLKRQCLQRVIQLTTDPRMTAWANQKLAELDPAPSFDRFAEPPSAPAAPRPVVAKPTPQPASDATKPDYLLLGGFAAIVVLLIVIGVGAFTLLPNLQNREGTQVAAQNPPTQPPTLTAWPSTTPRPTLTTAPSRTPKPTRTGTPEPTETPTPTITPTPSQADLAIDQGRAQLKIYDPDAALVQFNRAIQLDRSSASAYAWRARTYLWFNNLNKTQADIDVALTLDPDNMEVIIVQGDLADAQGDDYNTLKFYNTAIEKHPNNVRPWLRRADHYINTKNYRQALEDIERAMQIDPTDDDAYRMRGHLYFEQDDMSTALADFEKAIELDPGHPDNFDFAADAYYNLHSYEKALEYYDQAIALAPKSANPHMGRGFSNYWLGNLQDAVNSFNKALSLDPGLEHIYYWRGLAYMQLQQYSRAVSDFTEAINYNPNACAYHNRCSAEVGARSFSKAVEDCTIAINGGGPVDALFTRARAYDGLGRSQEALADYQSYMLYASPNSPAGKYALERIEALGGQLAVCQSNGSPVCSGSEIALLSVSEQGSAPLLFCNH